MVSKKRYNHIIHWNIFVFSSKYFTNKKSTKLPNNLLNCEEKHIKEKANKTNIQDKSQETLNVSSLTIFF